MRNSMLGVGGRLARHRIATSRRLCTSKSSISQQPWALSFMVDEQSATAAFHAWTKTHSMTSGTFELRSVQPHHLPFYMFTGVLTGTFTGVCTYSESETFWDLNGKKRNRTKHVDYVHHDIPFAREKPLNASNPEVMGVYAGFDFRRTYVEQAALLDASTVNEKTLMAMATPLTTASSPASTGVGAFAMKPSFAFRKVWEGLNREAHRAANQEMNTPAVRSLKFRRTSGYSGLFGTDVACPATDWQKPGSTSVRSVKYELSSARLHERGVLMLPIWVVDYSYAGEPYRCFVSGLNGRVGGITHLLTQDAIVRGGGLGLMFGLGVGLVSQIGNPTSPDPFWVLAGPPIGAIVGALGGYFMAAQRAATWEREGTRRADDEKHNRSWQVQAFWQNEVKRVMFGDASGDGASDHQQQMDRELDELNQQQKSRQLQMEDWREMDDYALLGLVRSPPPSSVSAAEEQQLQISAAFRREAMRWHPDHNQFMPEWELAEAEERRPVALQD